MRKAKRRKYIYVTRSGFEALWLEVNNYKVRRIGRKFYVYAPKE